MHVTPAIIVPAIRVIASAAAGRAGPKGVGGIALVDSRTQDAFVEAVVVHEIAVAIFTGFLEPAERADIFIVPAPERQARVIAQAFDLVPGFLPDQL